MLLLTKRLAAVSLFLFLWAFSALAQEGLLINADNVSYEKEKDLVFAEGNVVATFKDIVIRTDHLIYDTKERIATADRGFVLELPEENFSGSKLTYNVETKTGTAENVFLSFRGTFIKGERVSMSTREISMTDASFTSCDEEKPHYHISASSITLYPEPGLLAYYFGFFWIGSIPVIPVPTYVYEISPREGKRNEAPIPEFGKNEVDGWFVSERLAWHGNERTYGSVNLTLTEKKGAGAELNVIYLSDRQNEFNLRVGGLGTDGYFGGLTYFHLFGPEPENSSEQDRFYRIRNRPYQLEIDLSSRERINFQRVTAIPDITLRLVKMDLFSEDNVVKGEIGYGFLAEESTEAKRYRTRAKLELFHYRDMGEIGRVSLGITPSYKWYEEKESWRLITGNIGLKKVWSPIIETGIGYLHYFLADGSTPFLFETYYFRPDDEALGSIGLNFGGSNFKVSSSHYMPDWEPKDIDYSLSLAQHCYDIIIMYRGMRQELSFGVSLTSN